MFFDAAIGSVVGILARLIGAIITFLLMNLGQPKQTEECITFHDEDRDDQLKEVADLILKRK